MPSANRIESIYRIIRGVGDINMAARCVDSSVIEAALSPMWGKSNVSDVLEGINRHENPPAQ